MNTPSISVEIPADVLAKLKKELSPQEFRQATFQVVKRTTAKLVTIIRKRLKEHSTINKKYVDRVITQFPPKGDPPVGMVRIVKAPIPLVAFKFKASKGGGVSVVVSKDIAPILLRHAFLATMKAIDAKSLETSTHKGIFYRARHTPTKGPGSYLKDRAGKPKYKLTPAGIAGRLAIKQAMGPSVLTIVAAPELLKEIDFDTIEFMRVTAEGQLSRFAGKKPPAETP